MRSGLTARARIRDAALARFGTDGVAGTSVRAVAADAGVSAALVLHHFDSKEGLRQACDEAATPVRRYLARALLDGTDSASALFDEIVAHTEGTCRGCWLLWY